jgi:drug/metabolite transporter (DMT)-like permease
MERLGELAAFGTALCWTTSALFFEGATRAVGALAVNFWKVVVAFFLLGAASIAFRGMPLPLDASPRAWLFLAVSGVVGFVVADYFLFTAYSLIGSRITVLFQALTPIFTALLAFLVLGERMRRGAVLGMALVVCGILIVVLSRAVGGSGGPAAGRGATSVPSAQADASAVASAAAASKVQAKGYVFAFLAAVFQAVGLIFSKIGLGGYNPISGTQIRVMTAAVGFGLQALLTGKLGAISGALRQRLVVRNTAIGSVFGPFLGVVFSLYALQNASAGAASTLMALTPVLIIPPSILLLKQRVKPAEILGAAIAVAGAALFFLL